MRTNRREKMKMGKRLIKGEKVNKMGAQRGKR